MKAESRNSRNIQRGRRPGKSAVRLGVVLIFLVSFGVRFSLVLAAGQYQNTSRYEVEAAALNLARTKTLASPYSVSTGPTAHVMPGHPAILAGVSARRCLQPGHVRRVPTGVLPSSELSAVPVSDQLDFSPDGSVRFVALTRRACPGREYSEWLITPCHP